MYAYDRFIKQSCQNFQFIMEMGKQGAKLQHQCQSASCHSMSLISRHMRHHEIHNIGTIW